MTDKEKYTLLMQRFFDAETTPEEERELARYATRVDDPAFDGVRGVLGYLSIGRRRKAEKRRASRLYALAAAAVVTVIAAVGIGLSQSGREDDCVRYAYGEKVDDDAQIMMAVESSLSDFFGSGTAAELNLKEMFDR